MISGIYMIKHMQNGKIYIGSSEDVDRSFACHRGHYGRQLIHRAIKKYGPDAFEWLVLEECSVDDLISREQHYLDTLRPFGEHGYNIREVADRNTGIIVSVETRAKMSAAHKGKPKSEAFKE